MSRVRDPRRAQRSCMFCILIVLWRILCRVAWRRMTGLWVCLDHVNVRIMMEVMKAWTAGVGVWG